MRWECVKVDPKRKSGWEGYTYRLLIADIFTGEGELSCGTIERRYGLTGGDVRVRPAAWVVKYDGKAGDVRTDDIADAETALCRMTKEALCGVKGDRENRIARAEGVISRAEGATEQLVKSRACVSAPGDAPERLSELVNGRRGDASGPSGRRTWPSSRK